ncbi:MAG: Na/Pi symporter, partial [Gammaproteobacteria bacterium]|nr:Na/Pi symporter [Gammaproteobacteria bacterium]
MKRAFYPAITAIALSLLVLPSAWGAITLESTDQPASELFALILGGAGIFLVGIHFAGDYLQQMTSGTVREIVTRVARNRVGMFLWGLFLGFFTQSGKATAFILSDFVQAGLMKPRQAAPMVYWGNAGSSLIAFVSMLSVKIFALLLLGVTAFGLTFHYPKRLVQGYGAMFGLGMIIFGLFLVKNGAAGFAAMDEVSSLVQFIHGNYLLCFLAGLVLTLVVQSNIAIMLIGIAMATAGLFGLEETAMVIFGAQAGTGILTWIFSSHSKGSAREVVITQISFDIVATAVFVVLFYLEHWLGLPLLMAAARMVSESISGQAIFVALAFQFAAAGLLVVLRNPVFNYIEARFPPSATEVLSETRFLHKNAGDSPETGLLLVEKEQGRLLERLPLYIDALREESAGKKESPSTYHAAFVEISRKINETLSEISRLGLNTASSDELIRVTKMQEQLLRFEDIVFQLTTQMARQDISTKARELGNVIMESADFIMLTAIDAIESREEGEIDTLETLTQDRSALMTKMRHNYFNSEQDLSDADRNFVLDVTILFENVVQTLA